MARESDTALPVLWAGQLRRLIQVIEQRSGHDVLRVEQVALSKAHDTFSMATELHVSICYSFDRIRLSFDSKAIENAV